MSIGPTEMLLILAIGLLFFGPSRLPGLGKSMGEAIRGFKKGLEGEDEKPTTQSAPKPSAKPANEQLETDDSATVKTTVREKDKIDG